jgi:hypothetical protein
MKALVYLIRLFQPILPKSLPFYLKRAVRPGVIGSTVKHSSNLQYLYFREKDRLNNVDKGYVFKYPLNSLTGSYSVITGSASTLPSITIEGKTYLEAIVYIDQNGLPSTNNNFRKSTYYWVKGIGIIKREIRTSNSIKTETLVRNG